MRGGLRPARARCGVEGVLRQQRVATLGHEADRLHRERYLYIGDEADRLQHEGAPCLSPYLPTSPHISPHLPTERGLQQEAERRGAHEVWQRDAHLAIGRYGEI